jgi:hypothetical protein
MQQLNLGLKLVVYSDSQTTTNPKLKDVDYDRQIAGVVTDGLFSKRYSNIAPGASVSVASTTRATSVNANTQWTVTLVSDNTYRYRWTGGTDPVLRTVRAIGGDATTQWTVTINGPVVRYTASAGTAPSFGTVQVGDNLLIETGGPFNVVNTGLFVVLGTGSSYIEISNPSGVAEGPILTGTLVSGLPVISVFSNGPVEVGDEVRIKTTVPFNVSNVGAFKITRVTSKYFDVQNPTPGYPEGPITTTDSTGVIFYPSLYKWAFIESDQRVTVRFNDDTTDNVQVDPIVAGTDQPGILLMRGVVYSLSIVNRALVTANVKVVLSE